MAAGRRAGEACKPESCVSEALRQYQEGLRAAATQQALRQEKLFADFLAQLQAGIASCHCLSGCPLDEAGSSGTDRGNAAEICCSPPLNGHAPDKYKALRNSDPVNGTSREVRQASTPPTPQAERARPRVSTRFEMSGLAEHQRATLADKLEQQAKTVPSFTKSLHASAISTVRWYEELEEPERTGAFAGFVQSSWFTALSSLCICLNIPLIVASTDYEMKSFGSGALPTVMRDLEIGFLLFYCFELIAKLVVHRLYFFVGPEMWYNTFDFFLVFVSILEFTLDALVGSGLLGLDDGVNISFLRCLRVLKLARIMRVLRLVRMFSELRVMLNCVVNSILTLFWCTLLLLLLLYVFSLLIMQALLAELYQLSPQERATSGEEVRLLFGSLSASVLTLLQSTTGGKDWGDVFDVLSPYGVLLSAIFLFYIVFFTCALWNIVTSTFVDKALRMAKPDLESLGVEQSMNDHADGEALIALFKHADIDASKGINKTEFKTLMESPKFRYCLQVRGIDIANAESFFDMLCSRDGATEVPVRMLVGALLRMKGFATSIDLHSLSFETKMLSKNVDKFVAACLDQLDSLRASVSHLGRSLQNQQLRMKVEEQGPAAPPTAPTNGVHMTLAEKPRRRSRSLKARAAPAAEKLQSQPLLLLSPSVEKPQPLPAAMAAETPQSHPQVLLSPAVEEPRLAPAPAAPAAEELQPQPQPLLSPSAEELRPVQAPGATAHAAATMALRKRPRIRWRAGRRLSGPSSRTASAPPPLSPLPEREEERDEEEDPDEEVVFWRTSRRLSAHSSPWPLTIEGGREEEGMADESIRWRAGRRLTGSSLATSLGSEDVAMPELLTSDGRFAERGLAAGNRATNEVDAKTDEYECV